MEKMTEIMKNYSENIVGPTMLEYVKWILLQAKEKGLKRIYFLARDGYMLCEMARLVSCKHNLDIDCRYLYCSRSALRMPSYHILSENEMYDLLLLGGYYVTPKSLLERADFSNDELSRLYKELDIQDFEKCLNETELNALRERIKENEFYKSSVLEKSKNAYKATIDYFKQEGLFDNEYVAIADSGWTGSMQRSLHQLLEADGYHGKFIGFYFGMYVAPKDEADGEYNTFYFSKHIGDKRKIHFNNNLFECMLSAPHPMTLRYEYDSNNLSVPIFADEQNKKMLELIKTQINGALEYTKQELFCDTLDYNYKKAIRRCYKRLNRAMIRPTRQEAEMLSLFTFCDDITEKYSLSLANGQMRKSLKKYMILHRIFNKLFGKKQSGESELFWPYGVIAFCPKIIRPWYRFNILCWDFLKIKLKK